MQMIATNTASKALVAVVAVAMMLSAFVSPAKAATEAELQAQIDALMAEIAKMQGGSTTTGSSASVCPYTWTRDLKTGATGADVMTLQKFLNASADTMVAATGAGSAGMETSYFGPATAAAVSKFQVMHRADVLTPAGLTNPTGFFGPSTRAKANALCVTSTTGGEEEEEEEEEASDLSGEADLFDVTIDAASDDEVEEGDEDAEVAEVSVEFRDGDASISRLDVSFSTTTDVWDVLDTVSLWVDGEMVADMDASDEDEYLSTDAPTSTLRFSGLEIVAMEDEELDITIAATFQGNVDSEDLGAYNVSVDSIRFFDADGVASTEESTGDLGVSTSFTLVAAGADDEILVKTSSNDPEAATLQVEDDAKSDFMHVFSFDIDTDDSTNDIELDTVVVNVATTGATYAALVDDAELEIDGTTIDDVTVTTNGSGAVLTFDVDGDVTVEAGDRVEAKLMLRFKALTAEGATVAASISSGAITGEGADDETSTGAATGDTHTLRSTGVDVSANSDSVEVEVVDGNDNDYATYEIVLDVTAFEQDVFVPITAASTTWKFVDGNGADLTVPAASTTVVITSSAEEGGAGNAFFQINEGDTETVTVTVTFTPGANSPLAARLQLLTFVFDETGTGVASDDETWTALPATDYRTDTVTIQN